MPSEKKHFYIDNKAPILLVAHIDTVQAPTVDMDTYTGAGFDDRLGVYIGAVLALNFPDMFDLLLTDYEECGRSTASFFVPSHDYNFIVGLDREGLDYVDYGLASDRFNKLFEDFTEIKHSWGSFSDICSLDHIECSKINLGIGVHRSHSADSYFSPEEANIQIDKLLCFCNEFKDTHFEPGEGEKWGAYGSYANSSYCGYGSYGNNAGYLKSADTRLALAIEHDTSVCEYCGQYYYNDDLLQMNMFCICENCCDHLGIADIAMPYKIN